MGQAKQRGTFEERKAQAIAKSQAEAEERAKLPKPKVNPKAGQLMAMATALGWDPKKAIR